MADMVVSLRGKRWKIRELPASKLPQRDGECDHPNLARKEIRLRNNLGSKRKLEIALHEGLHACLWDLDEEAIEEIAHDLARMVWRLGYRHVVITDEET